MTTTVFKDWTGDTATRWGVEPQCLQHGWTDDPLFSMESLAALIEGYPAGHYALVRTTGRGDDQRVWREGDIGGLTGREVIAAISQGSLWLNLRNVHEVDPRYGSLLEAAHAELRRRMPGFEPSALRMGILISSPHAQVHYHADLPGQALWQIAGRKRVVIYPPQAPYLPDEALEQIALTGLEVGMRYDPAFDAGATTFELQAGQMLHWPLNSPHRVDNLDCLNISVTTEYWTPRIRRSQQVTLANGLLRRWGLPPRSRALDGIGFHAKAALQAAWRRSPWATRQRRLLRPVDFRLSRDEPGGFVDTAPTVRGA